MGLALPSERKAPERPIGSGAWDTHCRQIPKGLSPGVSAPVQKGLRASPGSGEAVERFGWEIPCQAGAGGAPERRRSGDGVTMHGQVPPHPLVNQTALVCCRCRSKVQANPMSLRGLEQIRQENPPAHVWEGCRKPRGSPGQGETGKRGGRRGPRCSYRKSKGGKAA